MQTRVCALALVLVISSCSGAEETAGDCTPEPVESETGLRYEDVECGSGAEAAGGDSVTIEYRAETAKGEEFASSDDQGGEFVFPLGRGQVLTGLDEGVRSMKVGGTRRMTIPPDLAYGEAGFPPAIGPEETVVYEVTLLGVTGD
jgi:FKBP-type peptidyl-prolyl cis-trans isomerase FkpA